MIFIATRFFKSIELMYYTDFEARYPDTDFLQEHQRTNSEVANLVAFPIVSLSHYAIRVYDTEGVPTYDEEGTFFKLLTLMQVMQAFMIYFITFTNYHTKLSWAPYYTMPFLHLAAVLLTKSIIPLISIVLVHQNAEKNGLYGIWACTYACSMVSELLQFVLFLSTGYLRLAWRYVVLSEKVMVSDE